MSELVKKKFRELGVRVRFLPSPNRWPGRRPDPNGFSLNLLSDRRGAYFAITAGNNVDMTVVDLRPHLRHLLLMAETAEGKSKFLCGQDERDWFVAAIPENRSAGDVLSAMEALKPDEVLRAQAKANLKGKDKRRRRTKAYVRQGEWFFLPCPELEVDKSVILSKEPLRRGRGTAHIAQFAYRTGGQTVYVSRRYSVGLTESQYHSVKCEAKQSGERVGSFRTMVRNPTVFVRGTIRHPDHKTIRLDCWHEVRMNTENQSRAMQNVVFFD